MERRITGYRRDDAGDWVAQLDCGHGQHLRHRPPFFNRPWVETEEGRQSRLGARLDCLRCDRHELPEGLVEYKRTPSFSADSIPPGLLKDHATKAGVWGRIRVEEGLLHYHISPPDGERVTLRAGEEGVVVPEQRHCVRPEGPVRFHVAFFRVEAPASPP